MAGELLLIVGVAIAAVKPAERYVNWRRWQRVRDMELYALPLAAPDPELDALLHKLDAID